jgi:hypothetical protein
MAPQRNYASEYARRIQRGQQRGLSRSQARGHPGTGERHISARVTVPKYDPQLEAGLKAVRGGESIRGAAKSIHVAPERLRQYIAQTGVAENRGRRWRIGDDRRVRDVPLYTGGRLAVVRLPGYDEAYRAGRFMAAVSAFLATNDASLLAPFEGEYVTDVDGTRHVFETRPNVLYRLSLTAPASFEQIYRIVA